MNTEWLASFVAAAKYENFHQAAEQLYRAQPTITVHIKQLEKALGIELFVRKGRSVVLTQAGRVFYRHAEEILERMRAGEAHMDQLRQGYERTLTISVSPLIAATYLPYWLKAFLRHAPTVEVDVRVTESEEISDEVNAGKADLGLSRTTSNLLSLTCEPLYDEDLIIVAPHDGRDAEQAPAMLLEELVEKERLLTHNHPEYWDPLLGQWKQRYPHIRTMKVSQVHVTKRFVEEGIGFSVLPRSVVQRELAEGRMIAVRTDERLPFSTTYALWKEQTPEVQHFLKILKRLV